MFTYQLIRSRRRSVALEITRNCEILIRAPLRMSLPEIEAFAESHADWVEKNLETMRARMAAAPPPSTPEEVAALKQRAREILPQKVAEYSRRMGVAPTGIRITAARSRYGSCSAKNSLCFSCFLMNSPDAAIDLVVVHELCHIRYKNHGPMFYALLSAVLPDYRERKKLLVPECGGPA